MGNHLPPILFWLWSFFLLITAGNISGCSTEHSQRAEIHPVQILGGEEDVQHSDVGALVDRTTQTMFCSATLLSNQWIITAAHCVHSKSASRIAFAYTPEGTLDAAEYYDIASVMVHPDYVENLFIHDIALLQTSATIPVANDVVLPDSLLALQEDTPLSWVGLGTNESGENGIRYTIVLPIATVGTAMFTAEYDSQSQQGICFGDSGGPVFFDSNEGLPLAGIISNVISYDSQSDDCIGSYSAVRVDRYYDWIKTTMGERTDLVACTSDNDRCFCNDACVEGQCQNALCQSLTCEDTYDCLSLCASLDGSCMNDCFINSYSDELTSLNTFLQCGQNECSTVSSSELVDCLTRFCEESFSTCFAADACAVTGGDCHWGTSCVFGRFGLTYCQDSQMAEMGDSCLPDNTDASTAPCMDGMTCAFFKTGYECQKICSGNPNCPSGMACQLGEYDEAYPNLGFCRAVESENADSSCAYMSLQPIAIQPVWKLLF